MGNEQIGNLEESIKNEESKIINKDSSVEWLLRRISQASALRVYKELEQIEKENKILNLLYFGSAAVLFYISKDPKLSYYTHLNVETLGVMVLALAYVGSFTTRKIDKLRHSFYHHFKEKYNKDIEELIILQQDSLYDIL